MNDSAAAAWVVVVHYQLRDHSNLVEPLPWKPKGMRWKTYWRHRAAYEVAKQDTLAYSYALLERLK